MKFWIEGMYQELHHSAEILIYGAGMCAKEVYPVLKKMGLREKIAAFVVTDVDNSPVEIDGIPVCSVKDLQISDTEKYTVLIAVSDKYFPEIIQGLTKFEFSQIYLLKSFIHSKKEIEQASDEQFLKYIRETYIWDKVNSMHEFEQKNELEKKRIEQRKREDIEKDEIVFIIGQFAVRHVNIISALVRKGYKIKILEYGFCPEYIKNSLYSIYDIEHFKCSTFEELLFLAMQYNPLIYFFQPAWGDCSWAAKMIKHKNVFGKIVLSLYDVMNDAYIPVSDERKGSERYSLENADGIVWRWFSKEYLEEKKGFSYKGKSIQFLDYCADYGKNEKNFSEGSLKLCIIAGDVSGFLSVKGDESGTYTDLAKIESIMKKIGNREDCILHVFAGVSTDSDREVCSALEREYHNIKFFYSLQHNDLIKKIAEYDYGCLIYTDSALPPYLGAMNYLYFGSAYYNAVTNKLFDYISAGIPFITTGTFKLCKFFEQYGVVVNMNLSNLDIENLIKNRAAYREKAKKAREELLIDNQIQTLIDFFEDLYE